MVVILRDDKKNSKVIYGNLAYIEVNDRGKFLLVDFNGDFVNVFLDKDYNKMFIRDESFGEEI